MKNEIARYARRTVEVVDALIKENPEMHMMMMRINGKYFDWYVRWLKEKLKEVEEGEDNGCEG